MSGGSMKLTKFAGKIEVNGKEVAISYDTEGPSGQESPMFVLLGLDPDGAQWVLDLLQGRRRRSLKREPKPEKPPKAPRAAKVREELPAPAVPSQAPKGVVAQPVDPAET